MELEGRAIGKCHVDLLAIFIKDAATHLAPSKGATAAWTAAMVDFCFPAEPDRRAWSGRLNLEIIGPDKNQGSKIEDLGQQRVLLELNSAGKSKSIKVKGMCS